MAVVKPGESVHIAHFPQLFFGSDDVADQHSRIEDQKGKDDEGRDFENTSIDTQSFHSDNLFGLEGLQNSQKTAFIIDGIYCSENQDYEMQKSNIENEVRAMMDRINQRLPEGLKRKSY